MKTRRWRLVPFTRMLVAYASGQPDVKKLFDAALATLKAPVTALFSTLGRIAARALETQLLAGLNVTWIEELGAHMASGNLRMHNGDKWDPKSWPKSAEGFSAFSRRHAVRWDTGWRSRITLSKTTRR